MATWSPTTQGELERLLLEQLSHCSAAEQRVFERVRIPLRAFQILRVGKIESVFAVCEHAGQFLIFEDIEQGFEWCLPDADGVIRSYGCNQAGLQPRLYELLHAN